MSKISLITLQYINNYGSVLQTYASQEYLNGLGCSVEVVNFTRENCRFENLKLSMKEYYKNRGGICNFPFVPQLLTYRWKRFYIKRNQVFDDFRENRINLSKEYNSRNELLDSPPLAGIYCVGSDQVWNYLYNDGILPEYYLSYAPRTSKKFSLASSIGVEQIDDANIADEMKELLSGFDLVTVREHSTESILLNLSVPNCHQILDPTLLISREKWIEKLGLKEQVDYPYILVYQLNPCLEMDLFAEAVAKEKKCKIIAVSNNLRLSLKDAKILISPKVEDFLSLILFSQCVITDSFHGTAFSLNFNKEFFTWLPKKYSTRLTSVLELVGVPERAFSHFDDMWCSQKMLNYSMINAIIDEERLKATKLIDMVINNG